MFNLVFFNKKVIIEKFFEGNSFSSIPCKEALYQSINLDIFNALVNDLIDLLLIVIFYLNLSVGKETQPNFSDVPYELALRLSMVLTLLGVVNVFSFLFFSGLVADDMPKSPHSFLTNNVGIFDLARHDQVYSEVYQSFGDSPDCFD